MVLFLIRRADIVDSAVEIVPVEGDGHLHPAVKITYDRTEDRLMLKAAYLHHLGDMLMLLGEAVHPRR